MSTLKDLEAAFARALEAAHGLSNNMASEIMRVAHDVSPRGASVGVQRASNGAIVRISRVPGSRAASKGVADRAAERLGAAAEKIAGDVVGGVWD